MRTEQRYPQQEEFDFDRFFREQRRALERFIASRIGATGDADDLASEVFCQLIAYYRDAEPGTNHRALMYKIARNRIADHFMRRSKVKEISIEEAPQLPAHGSLIADVEARRELDTALDALRGIKDEYREIIILYANIGLTINEISEMMEKPSAHIRVLLFRARRALKRALRERGAFDRTDSKDS
ncbi:MAG: RNA polymerase sigma factor [bacterium]|nr:RNA polymerase sigma factor [bacterium]